MKFKFLLLLISIGLLSNAQEFNLNMKVSQSDLEINSFSKDSTANALIIYDYGNSFIDPKTFWLRFQIEQKIKILNKKGLDKGQVEIKLYKGKKSSEKILNIKGTTFNIENGEVIETQMSDDAIYKEENEDHTIVRFVLPNVRVGSVITYKYETQSRFISKFQPWYFQGSNPVLYSEYNTSIPGNYEYNIKFVGSTPLTTNDSKIEKNCVWLSSGVGADCVVSKYVMKDIPAYKPEGFTTTPLNYISRLEYELSTINGFDGSIDKITKTWEDVYEELRLDKNFGKQINKPSLSKNVLPESITKLSDDLEKAKAIYNFVTDNYNWNGKFERFDVSVKDLLKEKSGNAFEINLLLENLLSSQNIKTKPILLSTRENGLATKLYPVLTEFNYVILKTNIKDKEYLLDGTNKYLSFGEIPYRCLNQYGRLIDFEKGSYWTDINISKYSIRQHRVQLSASEDDLLTGTIESKFTGYHAHSNKEKYDQNPNQYKDNKVNEYSNFKIESLNAIDFDKKKYEFNESLAIKIEPEYIGEKIYFNPFILKFFDENPFKLQERTYPIDFGYKDIYNFVLKINLNEKLRVIESPKPINLTLPNNKGALIVNIEHDNNELTVYFSVRFNSAIYGPEYYEYIKEFMNKVVENQNNTVIVLEKI